jgi:hypothetical protein
VQETKYGEKSLQKLNSMKVIIARIQGFVGKNDRTAQADGWPLAGSGMAFRYSLTIRNAQY